MEWTVCVAVFHSWKLLLQSSTYQRDRRVTTVRKLPSPTTIVVGITARNLPIISWLSPFEADSARPATQSLEPSAPQWPPSPALPIVALPGHDWPSTVTLPQYTIGFRVEFWPAMVVVAAADHHDTFTVVKASFLDHCPSLGCATDHRTNSVLWPSLVSLYFARFRPPPSTV